MDSYQKRYFNEEIVRRGSKSRLFIILISASLKLIAIIVSLNVKTEAALEALEASLAYGDNVPSSSNGTTAYPPFFSSSVALGAHTSRDFLAPRENKEQEGSSSTMSTTTTDGSTSRGDESAGEPEFVCEGCGQSFKQAKYLRAHLNRMTRKCYDATSGKKYDLRSRK
jgi:hypothetical protein